MINRPHYNEHLNGIQAVDQKEVEDLDLILIIGFIEQHVVDSL